MNTLFESSTLAETAQILCEEWEFAIIPLLPKDKMPLESWADYQVTRPSPEQVEAWWKKWPNANIGVICGPHSNLLVLDCDSKEALQWAKQHIIQSPLCVLTSRGWHLYYKWPEKMAISELKQLKRTYKEMKIGLDLQISGNYVVGPRSVHPSGAIYTMQDYFGASWLDEEVPEFMPLIESTASQDRTLSDIDLNVPKLKSP